MTDTPDGPERDDAADLVLTGAALMRDFDPSRIASLVAPDPREAVARIARRYGDRPSPRGLNLTVLNDIRAFLDGYDPSGLLANGLMIVAPHSHWEKGLPILISRPGMHYVLREAMPDPALRYRPVSFALGQARPVAYEWADGSVDIPADQHTALVEAIGAVAAEFGDRARDLGMSINYRFKHPIAPEAIKSEEYPESDAPDAPGVVMRAGQAPATLTSDSGQPMEQVGWPAKKMRGDLRDDLAEVYDRVARILDELDEATLSEIRREL